jgi:hypothetical protein
MGKSMFATRKKPVVIPGINIPTRFSQHEPPLSSRRGDGYIQAPDLTPRRYKDTPRFLKEDNAKLLPLNTVADTSEIPITDDDYEDDDERIRNSDRGRLYSLPIRRGHVESDASPISTTQEDDSRAFLNDTFRNWNDPSTPRAGGKRKTIKSRRRFKRKSKKFRKRHRNTRK